MKKIQIYGAQIPRKCICNWHFSSTQPRDTKQIFSPIPSPVKIIICRGQSPAKRYKKMFFSIPTLLKKDIWRGQLLWYGTLGRNFTTVGDWEETSPTCQKFADLSTWKILPSKVGSPHHHQKIKKKIKK